MLERLKKIQFKYVLVAGVAVLLVLVLLNAILSRTDSPRLPGTTLDTEELGITQIATYEKKNSETGEQQLLVVYVEDADSLSESQLRSLIAQAARREGVDLDNVRVVIQEMSDENSEDYPDPAEANRKIDPTNPNTFPDYGNTDYSGELKFTSEPIEGITFDQFVTINNPATDEYEIGKNSDGSYLVILKQGYTEAEFKEQVLGNFPDASGLTIKYFDRDAYRGQ